MSMQEEKPTGYQSSEYKDTKTEDKFNDPIEGYHSQTESIMKATPSHGTDCLIYIYDIRIFNWRWFWKISICARRTCTISETSMV